MKKIICALFLPIISLLSVSQTNAQNNPYPKTITVAGSSEMEIVPDEIYAVIELKEYDKKGIGKIDLEKIKSDFIATCRSAGLSDSTVTITSYEGYNGSPWWRKKRRKEGLYSSIAYQAKFSNSKQMDGLIEKLDDDATQNFTITRTSHSKIQEYRKQLKIQAIKAAKEKAIYLSEAINEKTVEAITIIEPDEYTSGYDPRVSNFLSNQYSLSKPAFDKFSEREDTGIDFKKIKLRYDVRVVFALK